MRRSRPGGSGSAEVVGIVIALLVVIGIWWLAYVLVPKNVYFASPADAFGALWSDRATIMPALGSTCLMVLIGYAIAIVLAFVLSAMSAVSEVARNAIAPIALIIGSIPTLVITPVLLLLLGRGVMTAIVVCAVVTFFQAYISLMQGMRNVSGQLLDYVRVTGGRVPVQLRAVRIPSAVPALVSAGRLTLPAALSGVILAEVIATGTGIGNYINFAKAYFDYADMWAGIVAALIISALGYALLAAAERALAARFSDSDAAASR
jgi:ABC-type nitrate/sulfonate/bicarbonate transport system permease component